jgi:hypothetical protein
MGDCSEEVRDKAMAGAIALCLDDLGFGVIWEYPSEDTGASE